MAAPEMIWVLALFIASAVGQHVSNSSSIRTPSGICPTVYASFNEYSLNRLKGCVTILGNLSVVLMEKTNASSFQGFVFPDLREVTGYVLLYRVIGLESVGHLFPNLTRIRGTQLINNYALVIHDMPKLRDVGLHSLLKIDRGGVMIWGGPHTCYVQTIDWDAIAPNSRHMLTYPEMTAHCNTNKPCKCKKEHNHCWNNKKCQRFDTPNLCHPECLGCNDKVSHEECFVCRHYTYKQKCVRECPDNTLLISDNNYCVSETECQVLNGWKWRNKCVLGCPVGYKKTEIADSFNCEICFDCQKNCSANVTIDSLSSIQKVEPCVNISGSLTIHVRSIPGAVAELRKYLKRIEVVTDYIHIYGALNMTSLDFLPSLRRIVGEKLYHNEYSIVIEDMQNLRHLFSPKVMEQLKVNHGKLKIINNPMLCLSKINELKKKFPLPSNNTDIPPSLNGYSGGCEDHVKLHVDILNETSATVKFNPANITSKQYTVLYAKVPSDARTIIVPETCSDSEWYAIHVNPNETEVLLTSLSPASTYAVCIETFTHSSDDLPQNLARTRIINFTMPFTKPKPPFIQELVATSSNMVGLRWVDHKDYRQHITSYQLDVILIQIRDKDLKLRNHCDYDYDAKEDYSRHVRIMKPPIEYEKCAPSCMTLTSGSKDVIIEDGFDVCDSIESDCSFYEENRPKNSSYKKYVKTLSVDINGFVNIFYVKGLAPYRDYKFRLRSCAHNKCSRSTRDVIRTLRSNLADVPSQVNCTVNDTGHISVKWEPPDETNGPVLAYFVQILSGDALNRSLPDVWCQYPNERSLVVRLKVGKEFQVRVCSSTLGSYNVCSNWLTMTVSEPKAESGLLLGGFIFSIVLTVIAIAIGFVFKHHKKDVEGIPLVNLTSLYRSESVPPAVMFTDFMPLYSVPLNEALLE